MKQFNQQLQKKADAVKMRVAEKRELRERVISYMEYHPLPAELKVATKSRTALAKEIMSDPFWVFNINTKYVQSGLVLGALILFVGVPTLAEKSLPGDILYNMKVSVNEEIRSTLAFSPYAKVEWEAERLERRLSEARLLSQAGRLTEAVEQEVADAVKKHSDSAHETILAMHETDSENAILAEIAFASVLEAQADILNLQGPVTLAVSDATDEPTVATTIALAVADARTQTENFDPSAVTPEKLFALIERDTTYAEELFGSISSDTSKEEADSIDRRLGDIGRKVVLAQEKMAMLVEMGITVETVEAASDIQPSTEVPTSTAELSVALTTSSTNVREEETKQLIALLRTALTDTRKLISFMTDIEVRNSVTVENLVPITLTDEERTQLVEKQLREIEVLRAEIDTLVIEPMLEEKIVPAVAEAVAKAEQATAALKSGLLADAEVFARESLALITDSRALLVGSAVLPEIISGDISTSTATSTEGSPLETTTEEATSTEPEV